MTNFKPDSYMKFSKFYYVTSLLDPVFKKERTKTERRKQPTMYSGKLKV